MLRLQLVLALLAGSAGAAFTAAPSYSATDIVNASNRAPGPFAPNSVLTIKGTGLSRSTYALAPGDIHGNYLPTEMNYTQVFVDNVPVPLFYVSDTQINFVMPANEWIGPAKVRVESAGNSGPEVTVAVVDAAPALFTATDADTFIIATHLDYSLITADAPAHAGEVVVIFLTGLGKSSPNPATGELPQYAAPIINLPSLTVTLAGTAVDPSMVIYAGLTPGCAGLYQINLKLPANVPADPEIRVAIGSQVSSAGLKLNVQP